MTRFIDSPELFGREVGQSTNSDFCCAICGNKYGDPEDVQGVGDNFVRYTDFAGLEICENCFEKVENEVLHRMPDIINWYTKMLTKRHLTLSLEEQRVRRLFEIIFQYTTQLKP